MTCIVGAIDNGTIYMGADSAGVGGYALDIRRDSKIFINGEFLIGFTSSFRMGQLLRFKFTPPIPKENQDLYEYMVSDFVEEVRKCLKDGGYSKIQSNEETGGTFLVGYRGRLFTIEDDFQVGEVFHEFAAVGCGFHIALGSMYSTRGKNPSERIMTALEAAEEFSAGVRRPFNLLTIGGANNI
jgi:ATP-dependent protease HslVU (ClpYQ) peptidase subunit